jgi:hypothetical protein
MEKEYARLKTIVEKEMRGASPAHDIGHVLRVYDLCLKLARHYPKVDLKILKGEIPPPIVTLPHTPGHEVAGEVVEVGKSCDRKLIGIRAVVYFYLSCGECAFCRSTVRCSARI